MNRKKVNVFTILAWLIKCISITVCIYALVINKHVTFLLHLQELELRQRF